MDEKIDREVRRAKRERRLGDNPVCALCGHANLYSLKRISRLEFEEHHVGGWRHEWGLTVILCLNCHRQQTELIRDAGISMKKCRTFPETLVEILRCLQVFFSALAEACGRWAQELLTSIKGGHAGGKQLA